MGKVVCHMSKSKAGNSGGLTLHIDRTQKEFSANIDTSKLHLNFELVKKNGSIDDAIKARIQAGYKGTRAIRKDAITSQRYVLSGSSDVMNKMNRLTLMKWAKDSYDFFVDKYGEENIIRATVHCDEATPHMHLIVVPLTTEGKLSAKQFTGDKKKLKELHDNYSNKMSKYSLERGVEGMNRKHITTSEYYRYINDNELTAEDLKNHPQARELIGKLIEVADSKKGLKHTAHKESITKKREYNGQRIFKKSESGTKEPGLENTNIRKSSPDL